MSKNNKKTLMFSLVLVLAIIAVVGGGTFAYFQWTTGAEAGTRVNVTIEIGGITMHIEPEETEFVGLYPTNDCTTNSKYGDALVTIVNNTGTLAIPSFKLKVKVTDKDGNGIPSDALEHIRYTVVPIETTKNVNGEPVKGLPEGTCASGVSSFDNEAFFNNNNDVWSTFGMKFESVATNGSWTHIPKVEDYIYNACYEISPDPDGCLGDNSIDDAYLPRQYFLEDQNVVDPVSKGDVYGITFRGEAYTTTYQYYRVYVWVDEGYTTTIVGNTVSDPLQNAKIEITWSEESMVQQVSGESIDTMLAAGLYDNDGNLTYTWDELIEDEKITVNGKMITNVDDNLTGDLVVLNGITEFGENSFSYTTINSVVVPDSVTIIGNSAFYSSSIKEIKFGKNSGLTTIEGSAFNTSSLERIEIPSSVTSIEEAVFSYCSADITFAYPSSLTTIQISTFASSSFASIILPEGIVTISTTAFEHGSIQNITIPASVTLIDAYAFSDCSNLTQINFNGTMAQWNAIEKTESWDSGVPATKVICSDGEVNL